MKFFLFTLLAICFFNITSSFAQKVLPGYYLNPTADTIKGNFEYREWNNNPTQVTFINGSKNAVQLTPANCLQFTLNGVETYVSRKFERLTNPVEFTMTDSHRDTADRFESKHAFLLQLAESDNYTLLGFRDKLRENFFIEDKTTGILTELKNKVIMESNSNVLKQVDNYKKQLYAFYAPIAGEAYKLSDRLNGLPYDEKALTTFVQSFSTKTTVVKTTNAYPSEFMVFAGAANNSLTVTSSDVSVIQTQVDYPSTISPVFGVGYTAFSQRGFAKNYIQLQLRYSSFKNTGKNSNSNSEIIYQSNIVSFNAGAGRKWVKTENFSFFTSLLVAYDLLINNKELRNPSGFETKGNNGALNAVVETGITAKKFRLAASSSLLATRIHNYILFTPKHRSIQLTLGYSF